MWQLWMKENGAASVMLDTFDSVTSAAKRIIQIEGYPVTGVFFEGLVETGPGIEDESLDHLEHIARDSKLHYALKRQEH